MSLLLYRRRRPRAALAGSVSSTAAFVARPSVGTGGVLLAAATAQANPIPFALLSGTVAARLTLVLLHPGLTAVTRAVLVSTGRNGVAISPSGQAVQLVVDRPAAFVPGAGQAAVLPSDGHAVPDGGASRVDLEEAA